MAEETNWTREEIVAAVSSYCDMLRKELAGEPFSKKETREQLREGPLKNRSDGSIDYLMQNISAVMQDMGRPIIQGYEPAQNVGENAKSVIAESISAHIGSLPQTAENELEKILSPYSDHTTFRQHLVDSLKRQVFGPSSQSDEPERSESLPLPPL